MFAHDRLSGPSRIAAIGQDNAMPPARLGHSGRRNVLLFAYSCHGYAPCLCGAQYGMPIAGLRSSH